MPTSNLANFTAAERTAILALVHAGSGADHSPVQDETALALITDMTDKMVCLVEDTGLYRYDSTSTETAAAGNVVEPGSGVGRWIRISSISDLRVHTPVADETALAAIPAGERSDMMLCFVDANGLYRFDAASAATAAAGNVVAPGAGTGRWFRITQLTELRMHDAVADETALAAIVDGELSDRMLCYVDANGLYQYDSGSAAGAVAGEIVVPAGGTGRWIRITQNTDLISRRFLGTLTTNTYYVGFAGANDSNTGTLADPLATIQAAIDAANTATATAADIVVAPGTYAETLDFDSATLARVSIKSVSPGSVSITGFECDANSVLDSLWMDDLEFSGACSLTIAANADPFLATGFVAAHCQFNSSLTVTGATIMYLLDCLTDQLTHSNCGNVLIQGGPGINDVWRNEWDQDADQPSGVTASYCVLDGARSAACPVLTHVDLGAAAGLAQVELRGGAQAGNGTASNDCIATAQVANGAILIVRDGSSIMGSTDNNGNDNDIGANCRLDLYKPSFISNLQGWTIGGTVNDYSSFVSAEQTGNGAPQNVAHGLARIPEKVVIALTELPAPEVFMSTEQTGNGAGQTIAHGLSGTPQFQAFTLSQVVTANPDIDEAAADGTNLNVTVTNTDKYYAKAIYFPAAPDVAEGAHDATNVVVTVTSGVKYKVYAE